MTSTVLAVMVGLITALGWGFADFWAAKASKTVGAMGTLIVTCWIIVIVFVPVYPFLPPSAAALTPAAVGFAVLAGILVTVAAAFFYKALAIGPVSIVSPITGAYPLFTALLAIVLFKTHLLTLQIAAVIMIVLGVMTASGLFSVKKTERRLGRGPVLAVTAAVLYGVGFSLLAQAAQRMGWQQTALIEFVTFGVAAIPLVALLDRRAGVRHQISTAFKNPYVIGNGLLATLTIVIFNIGLAREHTAGAIVTAVSACYPALTAGLALRHFKEELRLIPMLGAGATIAGIVLLAIG